MDKQFLKHFLSTKHSSMTPENISENDHWFNMKEKSLCIVFEVFQYFLEKQGQCFSLWFEEREREKARQRVRQRERDWREWQRPKTSIISGGSSKWNYLAALSPLPSLLFSLEVWVRKRGTVVRHTQSRGNSSIFGNKQAPILMHRNIMLKQIQD